MSLKSLYKSSPVVIHSASVDIPEPVIASTQALSVGNSIKELYSTQPEKPNNNVTFISYDSKTFKKPSNKKPKYLFPSYSKK